VVLGILPEVHYAGGQIELGPGSVLALFSDGVTEAASPGGELFRERRVLDALQTARSLPAAEVLARILAGVERFAGPAGPADDLSLVIVRRESDDEKESAVNTLIGRSAWRNPHCGGRRHLGRTPGPASA
jgi:serine phosphatase RsbU (regulator of sigma subunit)